MKDILRIYKIKTVIAGDRDEVCGVKDYGLYVSNKLELTWQELAGKSLFDVTKESTLLLYPVQSYAYSIRPLIIVLLLRMRSCNIVLNLHEYSQKRLPARLFIQCLVFFSNHTIFTNEYERKQFRKTNASVTKIESNVINVGLASDKRYDLVYFGQIRPGKGIERFIREVERIDDNVSVAIIGAVNDTFKEYFSDLWYRIDNGKIDLVINKDLTEVSLLLNGAQTAFLPFPDGASSRRGSLLACLDHSVKVLTTRGEWSTEFSSKVEFIEEKSLKTFLNENLH